MCKASVCVKGNMKKKKHPLVRLYSVYVYQLSDIQAIWERDAVFKAFRFK